MDLIGLNELARRLGRERGVLLRQLRTMEQKELPGLLLFQKGKHGKIWVNREILSILNERAYQTLARRVAELEASNNSLKARVDELEARVA